jgi:cytochrome c oxidase cbb3-type subunit III
MLCMASFRNNLFAALLLFSFRLSAQEDSPNRVERGREFLGLGPKADPVAAARGQKTFSATCAFCHGENATGGEGPDLVRSTLVLHDEKGELIGEVVSKGRPERGMPAFPSLTHDQLSDLAQFLHFRVDAAANRFGYKMQNVVTGNRAAGKTFFDAHCTGCHSVEGDLAHIASKFEPADLQAQFLYPSVKAEDKKAQVTVTVTLPSGQTVTGRLKTIDDFTVSLWNEQGDYLSFDRSAARVELHDPLSGHRKVLAEYDNASMHNVLAYLVTLK